MLDPRRLLTFREVAQRRSFSRAAEALALTQPAVSQQVAALERQLGVRLLDRGPGGPAPTEAGALLLDHAEAIAVRLAQADAQLAELVVAERELLRVGAFPSALGSIVPAAIAQLRAERPELQVEAIEGSAHENGAAVAAGELHVAVCFQDVEPATSRARRHRAARPRRGADAGAAPRRSSAGRAAARSRSPRSRTRRGPRRRAST